jgi:hypothetical protein
MLPFGSERERERNKFIASGVGAASRMELSAEMNAARMSEIKRVFIKLLYQSPSV